MVRADRRHHQHVGRIHIAEARQELAVVLVDIKRRVFGRRQQRAARRRARRRIVHRTHRHRHRPRIRAALTVRHRIREAVRPEEVRVRRVHVIATATARQRAVRRLRHNPANRQRVTARIRIVRQQRRLRNRQRRVFASPAEVVASHRRRTQHQEVARRQSRRTRQRRKLHRSAAARAVRVVEQITRRAVVNHPRIGSRCRIARAALEGRARQSTGGQRAEHRVLQLNHIRPRREVGNRVNVGAAITQIRREHKRVSGTATNQRVIPKSTVQRVRAAVARQHVHRAVARQHVGPATARHVLNRHQRVFRHTVHKRRRLQ